MSKAQRTFRSAVWNHAGRVLEYILMYLTSILIARALGVADNGRFVGLFSLSQLLLMLASLGLETSLNKFIPQLDSTRSAAETRYIMRRLLAVRVAVFVVAAFLFLLVARVVTVPVTQEPFDVLLVVMAFTGLRCIAPLFAMSLTATLQTHITARINLAIRIVELAGVYLLSRQGVTVTSLFILFASTSALHAILYLIVARSQVFGEAQPAAVRPLLQFGALFWANTLVDFVLGRQGDVLFLRSMLSDPSPSGLYDVAYSIVQLATMAMTVGLSGVTFATFSQLAVQNRETMNKFYSFSIRLLSLLTIPLSAFILIHARDVLHVLYTAQFAEAESLVQGILGFRILSRLFGGPENAEYLLSDGKVNKVVGIGIGAAAVNVILNLLLIPVLQAHGAVIASGCGNVLVNALTGRVVLKGGGMKLQLGWWMKLTSASFFAAVLSGLLPGVGIVKLIVAGVVFAGVMLLLLRLIKPIETGDAEWLERITGRLRPALRPFTAGVQ